MPEIETARLRFRMLREDDLDGLMILFADPDVMKYLGEDAGATLSREEGALTLKRMMNFWVRRGFGRWAVVSKDNNQLVGLCGLRLLEETPELFYAFSKQYWGSGLATESAKASLRYGFEELRFERIVAVTRPGNTASINVMKKIGMNFEKVATHYGVQAVIYVATRDEFKPDDSHYVVIRN